MTKQERFKRAWQLAFEDPENWISIAGMSYKELFSQYLYQLYRGTIIVLIPFLLSSCSVLKSLKQTDKQRIDSTHVHIHNNTTIIRDSVKTGATIIQGFTNQDIVQLLALMKQHKDTVIKLMSSGGGEQRIIIQDGRSYLETKQADSKVSYQYISQIDSLKNELKVMKEKSTKEVREPFWIAYWWVFALIALILWVLYRKGLL